MMRKISTQRTPGMSGAAASLCLGLLSGAPLPGFAQMRADQQPVIDPPRVIAPSPAITLPASAGVAPDFERLYARAGRPGIVLLWNRVLSERIRTPQQERHVTRESVDFASSSSETERAWGHRRRADQDSSGRSERTKTVTSGTVAVEEPSRSTRMAQRHVVALERAFVAEMHRAGVRFVDRTLIVRTTAAEQHREDADPLLVEADAMLRRADLLMEVLWVEDPDAPVGYGFDVRIKQLRDGREVTSLYSLGRPSEPSRGPGSWVAGPEGYEFRLPPVAPAPSAIDIGEALAREVMASYGASLQADERPPFPRGRSSRRMP